MKKNGFTLIEILVAASIIAVLSAIGVSSYTSINMRSRNAKRKSDLEQVRSALEMYRTSEGSYPGTADKAFNTLSTDLTVLTTAPTDYLPALPSDPKSTSTPPSNYYYAPLDPVTVVGVTHFYGYCICANLESMAGTSSTCGAGVTIPAASCNYGLKNP
jgi:general secretion pathway protein G